MNNAHKTYKASDLQSIALLKRHGSTYCPIYYDCDRVAKQPLLCPNDPYLQKIRLVTIIGHTFYFILAFD